MRLEGLKLVQPQNRNWIGSFSLAASFFSTILTILIKAVTFGTWGGKRSGGRRGGGGV